MASDDFSFEEKVRDAAIIGDPTKEGLYRVFLDKGNFYVYRHVLPGRGYRGNTYPVEGYALAWSDLNVSDRIRPAFVPRREDPCNSRDCAECEIGGCEK